LGKTRFEAHYLIIRFGYDLVDISIQFFVHFGNFTDFRFAIPPV